MDEQIAEKEELTQHSRDLLTILTSLSYMSSLLAALAKNVQRMTDESRGIKGD